MNAMPSTAKRTNQLGARGDLRKWSGGVASAAKARKRGGHSPIDAKGMTSLTSIIETSTALGS